ncbi:MAG TPA: agmatinase [Bacteroidetes bacterium]|nr:agmatinase [Bacteroidota bacterium]
MVNFLGLEPEYSGLSQSRYCIYTVPFERTTTYGKGTGFGPEAILIASQQVELYDEELNAEPFRSGIATHPGLRFPADKPTETCFAEITDQVVSLLDEDRFVIGLGGEHSVSFSLIRAYRQKYPQLTILQLDAHADLRQSYRGSPLNHACVMARIHEMVPAVGIGIRSLSRQEADLIRRERLPVWFACRMREDAGWEEEALAAVQEPVYVTIDVDFFDPSIMPATGTPEPGGFFWRETLRFLRKLFSAKQVVGFDVMELAPQANFHAADFLTAKLVYKLIGYHQMKLSSVTAKE